MNGSTQATVIGGAITALIVYILDTYVLPQPLPDIVVSSLTTLICAACAHFVPATANPAEATLRFLRIVK